MLRKLFSASRSKKVSFIAGLTIAFTSLLGVGLSANHVLAADCDDNAVIKCGFTTPADFIKKVKANDSLNGHHDLQDIYRTYGLDSSEYDRFIKTAVHGYAYRNGEVKVDGQTVAVVTSARSLGRSKAVHEGPGFKTETIKNASGKVVATLYSNTNDQTFASGTTRIPVWVMFDGNGVVEFIVMDSCGNPTWGAKTIPGYSCKELGVKYDESNAKKVTFTTNAPVTNNAKVSYVVYDFGNGVTQKVTNPGSGNNYSYTYTYPESGSFTAKVTVYVSLPGGNSKTIVPAGNCIKVVNIADYACVKMDGVILSQEDKTKLVVRFTATGQGKGGATLTSADFKFGDPNVTGGGVQNGVKPDTANTVTATYTYSNIDSTKDFKANASATLHATANGKDLTIPACSTFVTAEKVVSECKPNVPVGSPECLPPCTPGSSVPPESEECQPPELPDTGAGNTIAIFSAVVIGGFLVYRQLLFRKHRAAFSAAEDGSSPLPLADPMSDTPLDGTPLEHRKRSTFRRKRMF